MIERTFSTAHSHPRSLDSASTPKAFAEREVELGSGTITCTDHGSLSAIYDCWKLGKDKGLISIPGLEAYFRDDDCPILKKLGVPKTDTIPRGMDKEKWAAEHPDGSFFDYNKYYHLTLHFRDYDAYLAGVKLLSKADLRAERHGSEMKPLFDWSDVEELAAHNVTATTSCLIGMAQRHLLNTEAGAPKVAASKAYVEHLHHLFGDRFYAGVFPHECTHNWTDKVVVTYEDGTSISLNGSKLLRTDVGELYANEWAKTFPSGGTKLMAISNYRKWADEEVVKTAVKVEHKEGFVQNECRPWSPGGDIQWGTNKLIMQFAKKIGLTTLIEDDCLAIGTMVRTSTGYKPVERIMPGELVITHLDEYREVEDSRVFRTQKKFVEIYVGGDPIRLTADHRVWSRACKKWKCGQVYDVALSGDASWTEAGNLVKGDLVYLPVPPRPAEIAVAPVDLSQFVNHAHRFTCTDTTMEVSNHVKNTQSISTRWLDFGPEEAWLIGFFLGDGNAHNNLTSFVADTETYTMVRPKVEALCRKMGMTFDEIDKGKFSVIRIINTALTQWFRKSFYDDHKVKTIPPWLHTAPEDFIKEVVSGIMYADGSSIVGADGVIRYNLSMTSLSVVSFVREWFLRQGVYCSVGHRMTTGAILPLWTVNLPNEARSVCPLWGESFDRKAVRWWRDGSKGFWIRVKSVESCESSIVCDLQVAEHSSFSTAQCVIHNSHFAHPQDKVVQDVRLAQHGGSFRFHNSYHRQSNAEAFEVFKKLGVDEKTFDSWVTNSHEWADGFKDFKFDTSLKLPNKFFPSDSLGRVRELIAQHGRLPDDQRYRDRLETEIKLLHENGKANLLPYFLLNEETCRVHANQGELLGIGRGSVGGSLVAYLLRITHIDPIEYDLSFDRFLTLDRVLKGKLPDVDQDFPRRDFLLGQDTHVVEFEAEDGTKHVVPETMKVDTDQGVLSIQEAIDKGANVTNPWWVAAE